jgi:restriction system protein
MSQAGYKYLRSYQVSVVIYDLTVQFCSRWIPRDSRTYDQMEQAARSGKQNIAEGYLEKSLKSYIYLLGVAYASLGELIEDYEDFLRQKKLELWTKGDPRAINFRDFRVFRENSTMPNFPELPDSPEEAANLLITLTHQAQYLLSSQIASLEEKFVREGGFTENLYKRRIEARKKLGPPGIR